MWFIIAELILVILAWISGWKSRVLWPVAITIMVMLIISFTSDSYGASDVRNYYLVRLLHALFVVIITSMAVFGFSRKIKVTVEDPQLEKI